MPMSPEQKRARRAFFRANPDQIPADKHGTLSGYQGYGCRCDACKKANADKHREYSRNKPPMPRSAHGSVYGYCWYGCRCDACRQAMSDRHYERKIKPRLLAKTPTRKGQNKPEIPYRPNLAAKQLIATAREAFLSDTGYAIKIAEAAASGVIAQRVRQGTMQAPTRESTGFFETREG